MCDRLERGVWWGEGKLRKTIRMQSDLQMQAVFEYLVRESSNFKKWADENQLVLKSSIVKWAIDWRPRGFLGWVPTSYEGEIHDNGYIYIRSKDLRPLTLRRWAVTTKAIGQINALGKITLKVADSAWLPSKADYFVVSINAQGEVLMHDAPPLGWVDRHEYVEGWIGDPFDGDETKRNSFLRNKALMDEAILAFRNGLMNDAQIHG